MARVGLNRAAIVAAAFAVVDTGGLQALTARALAAQLGVQAGAIYYHLPDMRSVTDAMATAMMREMTGIEPADDLRWDALLRASAAAVRSGLKRHRDGGRVFAGSRILDDDLITTGEGPLRILVATGLPIEAAHWAMQTVFHFTVGFVIEEQHRDADDPDRVDYTVERREARFDAATYPLTAAATPAMMADAEVQFAFGLQLILDGVAARIAAHGT
jgi:TetR/AcrR family transcriptional regulator, tetracycline repressor protein